MSESDALEMPQGRILEFASPVAGNSDVRIVYTRHEGKCLVYRFLASKLFDATAAVMRQIGSGGVPYAVGTGIVAAMRKLCGC